MEDRIAKLAERLSLDEQGIRDEEVKKYIYEKNGTLYTRDPGDFPVPTWVVQLVNKGELPPFERMSGGPLANVGKAALGGISKATEALHKGIAEPFAAAMTSPVLDKPAYERPVTPFSYQPGDVKSWAERKGLPFGLPSPDDPEAMRQYMIQGETQGGPLPLEKTLVQQYREQDLPWGVKGAFETMPWFAVPAAQTAGPALRASESPWLRGLGQMAKPAEAMETALSKVIEAPFKGIGKGIQKTAGKYAEMKAKPTQSVFKQADDLTRTATTPEGLRVKAGLEGEERFAQFTPEEEVTRSITTPEGGGTIPPAKPPATTTYETLEPVNKLVNVIKAAKPARTKTEELYHKELQKRVAASGSVLEQTYSKTGDIGEAFRKSRAQLGGELPRAGFEAPAQLGFTVDDLASLRKQVFESNLQLFDKHTVDKALLNIVDHGSIPTRNEIDLIERLFGPDLAKALLDKRSFSAKAWDTFLDVLSIPKTVLSTLDVSGLLRQAVLLPSSYPRRYFKTVPSYFKSIFSEKWASQIDDAIRSHPRFNEYTGAKFKMHYSSPGELGKLGAREEAYRSRLIEKVPILGSVFIKPFQRGYTNFLNKLRIDLLDDWVREWEALGKTLDFKTTRSAGHAVNVLTGRGDLGKFENLSNILNVAFWSPKLIASRIQTPIMLFTAPPLVRRKMWRAVVASLATGGTILTLLDATDAAEVETDPRSSDFGKIKVGNTRIDYWGGYQQYVVFAARVISSTSKSPSSGKVYDVERGQTGIRFGQSKLDPAVGFIYDLFKGKTYLGEEMEATTESAKRQAFERLVPFAVRDIVEAAQEEGLAGASMASTAMLGLGSASFPKSEGAQLLDLRNEYALLTHNKEWYDLKSKEKNEITRTHPDLQEFEARLAQETLEGDVNPANIDTWLNAYIKTEKEKELEALAAKFNRGEIDKSDYGFQSTVIRAEWRGFRKASEIVSQKLGEKAWKRYERWLEKNTHPWDKKLYEYYDIKGTEEREKFLAQQPKNIRDYIIYMSEEEWKLDLGPEQKKVEMMSQQKKSTGYSPSLPSGDRYQSPGLPSGSGDRYQSPGLPSGSGGRYQSPGLPR